MENFMKEIGNALTSCVNGILRKGILDKGEFDGVCTVFYFSSNCNGIVHNMGDLTDLIGAYYNEEDDAISFLVHNADDSKEGFPLSFEDFDAEVQAIILAELSQYNN